MKEITDLSQLSKNKVCVLDFSAEWCGPCKRLAPTLENLQRKFPQFEFAKIDIDNSQELANTFFIQSLPTVAFIRMTSSGPKQLRSQVVAPSESALTGILNELA
jgi:thiol-disulfide isomerase/thioredoxin